MSADEGYEVIEVPVQKIEFKLNMNDVLAALAQHASAMSSSSGQAQPQVAQQLQQLGQLADQLKGKIE